MLSVIFTQLTYIVKTLRWYSVNWYHFLSSRRRDLKLYWYREDKSICSDSWERKSRAFIGKIYRLQLRFHLRFDASKLFVSLSSLCPRRSRRSTYNTWRPHYRKFLFSKLLCAHGTAEWSKRLVSENYCNHRWLHTSWYGSASHCLRNRNAREEKWVIRQKLQAVLLFWWKQLECISGTKHWQGLK